jgi:hypothetical protein
MDMKIEWRKLDIPLRFLEGIINTAFYLHQRSPSIGLSGIRFIGTPESTVLCAANVSPPRFVATLNREPHD